MEPVALVTSLALLQYFAFGILVGRARARTGVAAPAMTGHPEFERYNRVHQNTLEQLVIFLPALWLFATYVQPLAAAGLGVLFIVGRLVYLRGYVANPGKRTIGFAMTALAQLPLLLGGIIGAVTSWL
jgi:glutathione S-transferase